jgi:hypothetical protein
MAETVVDLTSGTIRPITQDDQPRPRSGRLPVDASGRVRVWQIEGQRWLILHPVDAREQLLRGIVAMEEMAVPSPEAAAEEATANLLPSVHLETMTVKEMEAYITEHGLEIDLSKYRLKEEKVKALREAVGGYAPPLAEGQ